MISLRLGSLPPATARKPITTDMYGMNHVPIMISLQNEITKVIVLDRDFKKTDWKVVRNENSATFSSCTCISSITSRLLLLASLIKETPCVVGMIISIRGSNNPLNSVKPWSVRRSGREYSKQSANNGYEYNNTSYYLQQKACK